MVLSCNFVVGFYIGNLVPKFDWVYLKFDLVMGFCLVFHCCIVFCLG